MYGVSLKMIYILVLWPVLLASAVLTLTIDSLLGTSIEDCFERVAIGEQIPLDAIYRNVSELTTKECEQICKQDKQCQTYDYGVGAKGNSTCDLSNVNEKQIKEDKLLTRNPDYDVYVRRIQCEQSPPTPMDQDVLENIPLHRPVIRPDEDKRPLADEYYERPYEADRQTRPYGNQDRPDDYDSRPAEDRPPSYGAHTPQKIPYRPRPERPDDRPPSYGLHRPQEIPYRPRPDERPSNYGPHRPEGVHSPRPERPDDRPPSYGQRPEEHYRPDKRPPSYGFYEPERDPYRPERPERPYIRPDNSYDRPPSYGLHRPQETPYRPIDNVTQKPRPAYYPQEEDIYRPKPETPEYQYFTRPNRRPSYNTPIDSKPNYSYNSQYASNYGSSQDNSIHVEIYDPPRFKPPQRPYHEYSQGSSGYGQGYGYHQTSSSQGNYGLQESYIYESKPQAHGGYGPNKFDQISHGYGSTTRRPISHTNKPQGDSDSYGISSSSYGSSQSSSSAYGSSQTSVSAQNVGGGYESSGTSSGSSISGNGYGSAQPGSEYDTLSSYGNPNTNRVPNRPSSSNEYNQVSNSHNQNSPSYGTNDKYDVNKPYNEPSYDQNSLFGSHLGYGTHHLYEMYGFRKPYGSKPPQNSGYDKPSSPSESSYGTRPNEESYSIRPGSYGSKPYTSPDDNYGQTSYGSPSGYGSSGTSVGYGGSTNKPSLHSETGNTPNPNQRPKPTYDSYGDNKPYYDSKPDNYGSKPSVYADEGYQTTKPNYNERPAFNESLSGYDSDRPDIKPVYEFEEKPDGPSYISRPDGNIITTRPVLITDYEKQGYGRNPDWRFSYKACFRRVLAGRRALRSNVRRVVDCERLEDCMRECAIEKRFHCESFNYRLDPSFRGKGLCELMTKPIEAFDLHRDFVDDKNYDFYELDRNSLEPNCPETLYGPGLLHSGFLSSKQKGQDRVDWYDAGYRGVSRYDERRKYTQHKRYEDEFFVPYQIGVVKGDDRENWGQYGGNYGNYDSYYKNRNDFHKSYNHWRLSDFDRQYGVKHKDFDYNTLGKHTDHTYGEIPVYPIDNKFTNSRVGQSDVVHYTGKKFSDFDFTTEHKDFDHSKTADFNHNIEKQSDFEHHIGKEYWDYLSWKRGRWNTSESWSKWDDDRESGGWEGRSEDTVKDCSSRRSPGMSLGSGAVRRSLFARTVVDCETACFGEREFKCVSYSYRYSSTPGSDNCYLSERPYKGLDMSADIDSDVYAMPQHQGCHTVSTKPWVESECFWHVRSGSAVSGTAVKAALTVTGLGACEAECIRAHKFFCRGFSFRFEPPIGDDIENCILTSSPPTSLETGRGLRPSIGHELYSRGNYGRGCEPALYDDVQHRETQCYLQYDSSARLTPNAVRGQARVGSDRACGEACNDAPFRCLSFSFTNNGPPDTDNCLLSEIRLFDLQRGVDYEHSGDDLLFAFDLFNGQCWRKVYATHEVPTIEIPHPMIPTIEEHHPYKPVPPGPEYITGPSGPSGPSYLIGPDSNPDYKPSYLPISGPSIPLGPSGISGPSSTGPIEPPGPIYEPYKPYKPEPYIPKPYKPSYSNSKPHFDKPSTIEKPVKPLTAGSEFSSWRHYTVSGFPCRAGTTCAQNLIAGHWACEPEGGEIGSWDYCCAPTHRCGYSEGFRKPWCYVGQDEDQWRPCSEKYYPYHHHNVPHPSLGHREAIRPRPDRPINDRGPGPYLPEGDRKYWNDLYKNGPKAYYDKYGNPLPGYTRVPTESRPYIKTERNPPRSGSGQWVQVPAYDDEPQAAGLGVPRYWPVAYLHKSPPPNTTYFRFNETSTTTERQVSTTIKPEFRHKSIEIESRSLEDRTEKSRISKEDDISFEVEVSSTTYKPETSTTETSTTTEETKLNNTETKADIFEDYDYAKGLDGKLGDFTSIEVFNIEDAKTADKQDFKTLEAEEKQIEAIGRLLASKRGGKLVLDSKDLEPKNIRVDKDFMEISNRVPTRRGVIQRVSKEELNKEVSRVLNDGSLEVSETTFVRPPRILSTTENIRKTMVNGKVFYDASVREERDNSRRGKSLRVETNIKKDVRRNINPIRRVKRVYKKRYNPEEVRKRLLEREKSKNNTDI
ncbi:uncharacterized protein LOC110995354 [Pieris rapae]|uniref:uncharacterized protein LOC110995354 n=1 Tax=Pieris rapae TaxID=64459 RepID=UPI001E27D979|nr:uncharacterized protein LOC110995354 [Pieris rapae]